MAHMDTTHLTDAPNLSRNPNLAPDDPARYAYAFGLLVAQINHLGSEARYGTNAQLRAAVNETLAYADALRTRMVGMPPGRA